MPAMAQDKPLAGQTVGDVSDHVLKLVAIELDDQETPERQAAAKQAIDETLDLTTLWATSGDPLLTKAWFKLQRTVELNRNARRFERDPEYQKEVDAEAQRGQMQDSFGMFNPFGDKGAAGTSLFMRGIDDENVSRDVAGVSLFNRPEDAPIVAGARSTVGRSGVVPLFDEETRKRPALFDSVVAAKANEVIRRDLSTRADGSKYVELSNGEQVDFPNLGPDQTLHVTLDNGETQDFKIDSEFLSNLESAKHGSPISGTILGGAASWVMGRPDKVWTAYGERVVPKITGNPAIDREIFLKPEYQRAFEGAAVDRPWWSKALGAGYMVGEFAGLMALTHKAGGAAAGLAEKVGLTEALSTRGMGALGALTAETLGKAAVEGGGRRALALAGTNFDMAQIGEQVYYNSVAGVANGEVDPEKWVKSGVELGVAGYALGSVARAGRRAIAAGMEYGAFDTALSKISRGHWEDKQIQAWANRFGSEERAMIQAGTKAMNEARTGTVRSVQQAAAAGMYGEFGKRASREALAHIADAGFVGYQFGAWHGAQARAERDGKSWDNLGLDEKLGYFAREWPASGTGLAEAAGMIGAQGSFLVGKLHGGAAALVGRGGDEALQKLGRASMSTEQQRGVEDFAQHLVQQIHMQGQHPDIAAAADAIFGGAVTDASREDYTKERLNQLRGETADIAVDRAATFEGSHLKTMLTAVDKDGGEERLRSAMERATPDELTTLKQRLRLDPERYSVDRLRQAASMRDWIEQEQVRRVEEMQYPVPPEDVPERQGPPDERGPALDADAPADLVATKYRGEVRHETADLDPTQVSGFQRYVADVPRGTVSVREFVDQNRRMSWALSLPGEEDNARLFPHTDEGLAEAQRLGLVGGGAMAPKGLDLQSLGLDKMPALSDREKAAVGVGAKSKIEQSLDVVTKLSDRTAKQVSAFQEGKRGPITPEVETDAKTLIDGLREDNARREAAAQRILSREAKADESARAGLEAAEATEAAQNAPNRYEVADAARAVGESLADVPVYAKMTKGDRAALWLPLEAFKDRTVLRKRVEEARKLAREARRAVGVDREQRVVDRSPRAKAARAAQPKPTTIDTTPLFTDPALKPFAEIGRSLAKPGRGGSSQALRDAVTASNDVDLRIAAGDAQAQQQRHALIAGTILGAGSGAKSPMFLALLGTTAKEVERVRQALVASGASLDPHIADALDGILTPAQQAYTPTRELLRLIALGADATAHARSDVLAGEGAARWAEQWWKSVGQQAALETAVKAGANFDVATVQVKAMWERRMAAIRGASTVRGTSVKSPFASLAGRVAVAYGLGDYSAALDTKAPGGTLAELTTRIVDRLQGRSDIPIPLPGAEKAPEPVSLVTMPMVVGLYHSAHSTSKALRSGMEGLGLEPGSPEETAFLRELAGGGTPELVKDWSPDGVEAFRAAAQKLSAQSRAAVKGAVAIHSPKAAEAVDLVLEGLSSEAKGEAVPAGVLDRLSKLGFENLIDRKNGTIAQGAEHQLARLAQTSLAELDAQAAKDQGDTPISLYAGFGVEHAKDALRMATAVLDYSMGFRDRLMNNPVRMVDADAYSPHALSPRRLLDSVVRSDPWWETKAGKAMQPFMATFLKGWQKYNPLYLGKRGLASEDVRDANVKWHDARIDAAANTHYLHFQVQRIGKTMADARLSSLERQIVGRSIAANEAVRIRDRNEWEALPGRAGTGYLFDFVVDWNRQLVHLADEMVSLGLMEPEAAAHLRAHYFPRKVLEFAWGKEGMPEVYFSSSERQGPVLASSEFERAQMTDARQQQRTYDAGYVLPLSIARAAKRIELFRTLQLAVRDGVIPDKAAYDGMHALGKAQMGRAALDGPGSLKLEDTVGMSPADIAAETKLRASANVHQVMLKVFIEGERQSRGGDGQPPMTPALERLFTHLENGYVSHHVSNEIALLIEQTELQGGSTGAVGAAEVAASRVQRMAREWRQLRTIQNPKHWTMQFFSNAFTNAATGKVGIGDLISSILTGEGTYADASEHAAAWHKWVANGKNEGEATRETRQFDEFARLIGGHTIAQMVFDPVRPIHVEVQTPEGPAQFKLPEGLGLESSTTARNYQAMLGAVNKTGREHYHLSEAINRFLGSPSPVARSEAVRSLLGVYNLHELYWKYAAYLEGLKKGLSPRAAAHWGAEGTGDFSDRNPTLLRLSTNFAPERGRIRRLAEQRVGMSNTRRVLGTLAQSGIASPFWMYRASMMPALARSHATWTGIAATAAASLMIRAISQASGGRDDDLAEALAGKDSFFGMGLDSEALGILRRRYGEAPVPGFGGAGYPKEMRSTVGEWAQLWKAWGENALHGASMGLIGEARPEASMLTTARGPSMGGQSSYIDASQIMPFEDLITSLANEGKGDQSQAPDYGFGFLTASAVGSVSDMFNAWSGRKGKTTGAQIADLASKYAATWSAPFGGGPVGVLGSREAQEAVRTFAFDGRSVSEIADGLPASARSRGIGDLLTTFAARSTLPARRVTSYPSRDYQQNAGSRALAFLGWKPGDVTPGDEETAAYAERKNQIRGAALNMLSQAYKDFLDYRTVPYEITWSKMFDLNRDLVRSDDGTLDVTDNPSTEFGKWLRTRGETTDERRPWVQESVDALRRQRGQLLPLLSGADGLVRRKDVDPALHDRITRAAWDGQDQPERLMRVLWPMMQKDSNSGGALSRLWLEARIPGLGSQLRGDDREVWIKGQRWVKDHMVDAPAHYDLRQTLGPDVFDVAPQRAIRALPMKSRTEMAAQFTRAFGR